MGKPVGIHFEETGPTNLTTIFYIILIWTIELMIVYVIQLAIGNCCSLARTHYQILEIEFNVWNFVSANLIAFLGVFLNLGFLALILIDNGGALGISRGIAAFSMAGLIDGLYLVVARDV